MRMARSVSRMGWCQWALGFRDCACGISGGWSITLLTSSGRYSSSCLPAPAGRAPGAARCVQTCAGYMSTRVSWRRCPTLSSLPSRRGSTLRATRPGSGEPACGPRSQPPRPGRLKTSRWRAGPQRRSGIYKELCPAPGGRRQGRRVLLMTRLLGRLPAPRRSSGRAASARALSALAGVCARRCLAATRTESRRGTA